MMLLKAMIGNIEWYRCMVMFSALAFLLNERPHLCRSRLMIDLADLLETAYPELERRIEEGEHVTGPELAAALRANPGKQIPDVVFDYLCRFLEGKASRRRGPARKNKPIDVFRLSHARILYKEYLKEEKLKQKRERGARSPNVKAKMAPHEIAAKRIRDEFFPHIDYRQVLNLLSRNRNSARSKA
jgi:hypothetical protein